MPMHAQCDIVMANLFVCLSHSCIVSKQIQVSSNCPSSGRGTTSFFSATMLRKFQGKLPHWGIKHTWVGKKCDFWQKWPL